MLVRAILGLWVVAGAVFAQATSSRTILVLPFSNITDVDRLDWVGEGVSESVRDSLAAAGLLTLDRDERQEGFRRLGIRANAPISKATALRLGQILDADLLVFGEFSISPEPNSRGYLKVAAQIIDLEQMTRAAEVLQAARLEELARLQRELSYRVLQTVAPSLAPSREVFAERTPPVKLDALELYVRGLVAEQSDERLQHLTAAARLDPKFAQAIYEVGRLHFKRRAFREAADWLARVAPQDANYAESIFLLGLAHLANGEPARAVTAFQKAMALAPLGEVNNNLGVAWSRQSDLNRAVEQFERALEGDANDPDFLFNLAYARWRQGKLNECVPHLRAMLERVPEDGEAQQLRTMCEQGVAFSTQDARWVARERLKLKFEERAYRQLKALVEGARKKSSKP